MATQRGALRCRRKALRTTRSELADMPIPAIQGVTSPDMARRAAPLEPVIDAKTMEIHYTKHHKAYFNNFLAALKDSPAAEMDLKDLFAGISKQSAATGTMAEAITITCYSKNLEPCKK